MHGQTKNKIEFFDSYGNQIAHGDEVIIESCYFEPRYNGRKAKVEWNAKCGLFEFFLHYMNGFHAVGDSFVGVGRFKKVEPQNQKS